MKWLRLYHDTTTDPKWRLVSADSGQPVGTILSVWLEMLICASKAAERGTLEGWDDRVVAAHLGYRTDAVVSIRQAMQGVVLDGIRLTGWDKRQRQGSDDAAERQRRARANKQETPPDDTGGGVHHGPNGAAYSGQSAGNGASRDKAEMSRDNEPVSRDKEAMSRERHATNSNVTENPLNLYSSANSYSPVPESSLAPPIGGAGKKVVFSGKNFRLGAQRFGEWQDRYPAIPDFVAALQTIDAGLDGHKNALAEAQRRLLNQHQYWLKHDGAQKAKPKPHANRAGIRRLGGRSAA